ncbi:MAG: hypothetical protein ABJA87_03230 [bacterium]
MTTVHTLARPALIGLATGGRSTYGLTALALTAGRRDPSWMSSTATRALLGLAAAGETVADKLPATPSRLETGPLAGRLALGAAAGAIVVRREQGPVAVGAIVGGLGALAGSWLGAHWRGWAAPRLSRDLPGALAEDVTAAGLAAMAVA